MSHLNLSCKADQCQFHKHYEQVYRQHAQVIIAFILKLGHSLEDAEDLMQEAFLKFYLHQSKIKVGKERQFLLVVAKNMVIDQFRKLKFHKAVSVDLKNLLYTEGLWTSDANRIYQLERLGQLIEWLSCKPGGECFGLYYRDGQTLESIARQCRLPLGTVSSKIARLRKKVKKMLAQEGITKGCLAEIAS